MSSADHPLADLYARAAPSGVGSGYTSPALRSRIVRWFIALTVASEAFALVAEASQRSLLNRGVGGITLAEWHRSEVRTGTAALAGVVFLLVGGVFFLRWLHLCYRNLRELHVTSKFTPGWSVGYFFVPVLNLWRPKQVVDELWRATGDQANAHDKPSALIPVWWCLYIVSAVADRVASMSTADTFDDLQRRNLIFGASHAMTLVAGLCLFALVGRLTRRQEDAAARLNA